PAAEAQPAPGGVGSGGMGVVEVRRMWPDVLEAVKKQRRFTWIMLSQNAQVSAFDGKTLTVGLSNAGARDRFVSSGSDEILRQALIDVLGVDWRVEAIVDPSGGGSAGQRTGAGPPPAPPPERPQQPPPPEQPPGDRSGPASPESVHEARDAIRPTRQGGQPATRQQSETDDHDAHPDDPDADDAWLGHDELLARELGARVIEEIPHE
ncbi:MAG: DNA polymerase III subunit gamma/tau, partial [Actinomycetota bacterium]|nr:DNA polymerase III subunit gamma/tau [Actinomycetota bacterium]